MKKNVKPPGGDLPTRRGLTETVVVRIREDQKRKIVRLAVWMRSRSSTRVTASDVIRIALEEYLERVKEQLEPLLRARLDLPEQDPPV